MRTLTADQARRRAERWLGMRAEGMTNRDIAEAEGVSISAVENCFQRIPARYPDLQWIPGPGRRGPRPRARRGRRETIQCAVCGTSFEALLSEQRVTCSIPCRQTHANDHQRVDLDVDELERLFEAGLSSDQIGVVYGVSRATVCERLRERRYANQRRRALREMYVAEELPTKVIAQAFGVSTMTIVRWRQDYGIPDRPPIPRGGSRRADRPSVGRLRIAFERRRQGVPREGVSQKAQDVLDILRASPEPLPVRRIAIVASGLQLKWEDWSPSGLYMLLPSLRAKGLTWKITEQSRANRGRRDESWVYWMPVVPGHAEPMTFDVGRNLIGLLRAIEEQSEDTDVVWTHDRSLDAELAEGFTLLDVEGEYDEGLLAIEEAA